jgi:hypothetical protein
MALNTPGLKDEIKQLLTDMRSRSEISDEEFANRLSSAIETYVKTATIIYISGLTASGAPVTGTFAGNLE